MPRENMFSSKQLREWFSFYGSKNTMYKHSYSHSFWYAIINIHREIRAKPLREAVLCLNTLSEKYICR